MTGRNICNGLLTSWIVLALAGCVDEQPGAGEEVGAEPVVQKVARMKTDESIQALTLAQDTVPISRQLDEGARPESGRLVPPSKIFPSGDVLGKDTVAAQVFRIQLAMLDTYSDARRALGVAQEIFDQPVTLDYEVPYYKLRVGEFASRKEAEGYQQKVKGAGYANAWVMVATANPRQIEPLYLSGDSTRVDSTR